MRISRLINILIVTIGFLPTNSIAKTSMDLGEWLDVNNRIVIEYLSSLTIDHVDQPLEGVALTDGDIELQGAIYKGKVKSDSSGSHIYRFNITIDSKNYLVHYIWVDNDGTPLSPPHCPGTYIEPGGVAALSGDQHTYGQIGAGELVVTTCELND